MAARKEKRDQAKQWYWIDLIQRWQDSGHSQATFCSQENVSVKQFYYWYRQLRARKLVPDVVPAVKTSKAAPAAAFVPVQLNQAEPAKARGFTLEIVTPAGYVIRIPG